MRKPENSGLGMMRINHEPFFSCHIKYLIIIVILFLISQSAFCMTGTWPRCVGTCTANDIAAFSVRMAQQGTTFQLYSDVTFTSSGTRYNLHIVYDLYQDGNLIASNVAVCLNGNGCVTPNPTTNIAANILLGTHNYVPGSTYSMRNILFIYDTSTQPCACTDGSCSVFPNSKCKSIAGPISICPAPILSAPNKAICIGNSVQLSLSVSPAGGSYSYSWTPAAGLSSTTIPNPVANPTTTTTYTVTVTDTVCKSSATTSVVVTVYNLPTASFSASPLQGCSPLAVTFTDASTAPSGSTITKWEWDFNNDGTIDRTASSGAPFSFTYTNPGTYSVYLRVTTDKGCIATVLKTNYVTVNAVPACTITSNSICFGSIGTTSVPAFPGATYAWTIMSSDPAQVAIITAGQGTNTITWTASQAGTVTIGVTITGPAPTNCRCTSSVNVLIQGKPTVLAGSYGPICSTDTVSLVGTATNYASVFWAIKSGTGSLIPGSEPRYATFYPAYDPTKVFTQTALTFTATAVPPCTGSVSNDVTITVYMMPYITILIAY